VHGGDARLRLGLVLLVEHRVEHFGVIDDVRGHWLLQCWRLRPGQTARTAGKLSGGGIDRRVGPRVAGVTETSNSAEFR